MNSATTVTIPLSTADKLAQIARAMLTLSEEMKRHAEENVAAVPSFPIPDLTPPEHIPEDQAWFWTEEWQKGERKVNEDIRAGRISKGFTSVDDLFEELNHHV